MVITGVVVAVLLVCACSVTELVAGSHPHVRRFAHSLCATPEDAEDAAQEALIILYQRIGTLRASAALASWMFRIVRNECLRRSRAVLRPSPTSHADSCPSAEDDVMARLEAARVAPSLRRSRPTSAAS